MSDLKVASWFRPLFSVQNLVLFFAGCFILALFDFNKSELASWVQAFGSIIAIGVAFSISQNQLKRVEQDRILESISKAELYYAVADKAQQVSRYFGSMIELGVCIDSVRSNMSSRPKELFAGSLEAMKSMPVHDLGSSMLVTSHVEMLSSMSNMLRTMDIIVAMEKVDDQKAYMLLGGLHGDDFMLQGAWDMYKKAYEKRILSLNERLAKTHG